MVKRILVIDDEQSVRDAFVLALEEETAYEVQTAASGEEGIEKAKTYRPDLVFLDLRMPGMGGIESLRRLHVICPDTPVYVITAFYQSYLEPLKDIQARGIRFQLAKKPLAAHDIREIAYSVLKGPAVRGHE